MIKNYSQFLEKVQPDFFEKNPNFYLKNDAEGLVVNVVGSIII